MGNINLTTTGGRVWGGGGGAGAGGGLPGPGHHNSPYLNSAPMSEFPAEVGVGFTNTLATRNSSAGSVGANIAAGGLGGAIVNDGVAIAVQVYDGNGNPAGTKIVVSAGGKGGDLGQNGTVADKSEMLLYAEATNQLTTSAFGAPIYPGVAGNGGKSITGASFLRSGSINGDLRGATV